MDSNGISYIMDILSGWWFEPSEKYDFLSWNEHEKSNKAIENFGIALVNLGYTHWNSCGTWTIYLVGGLNPSEKWWSSSVGMMKFPTEWKNMFQTSNQNQWKNPTNLWEFWKGLWSNKAYGSYPMFVVERHVSKNHLFRQFSWNKYMVRFYVRCLVLGRESVKNHMFSPKKRKPNMGVEIYGILCLGRICLGWLA